MAIFKQKHAEFIEKRERKRKETDENKADLQEYEKETVISGVNVSLSSSKLYYV